MKNLYKDMGCPDPVENLPAFEAWHEGFRAGLAALERHHMKAYKEAKHGRQASPGI